MIFGKDSISSSRFYKRMGVIEEPKTFAMVKKATSIVEDSKSSASGISN